MLKMQFQRSKNRKRGSESGPVRQQRGASSFLRFCSCPVTSNVPSEVDKFSRWKKWAISSLKNFSFKPKLWQWEPEPSGKQTEREREYTTLMSASHRFAPGKTWKRMWGRCHEQFYTTASNYVQKWNTGGPCPSLRHRLWGGGGKKDHFKIKALRYSPTFVRQ